MAWFWDRVSKFSCAVGFPLQRELVNPTRRGPLQQHLIQKRGENLGALWEKVSQHSEGRNGRREQLRSWNATLGKGLVSHNPPEIEANPIHQPDCSSPSYPTQKGVWTFPTQKGACRAGLGGQASPGLWALPAPGFQGHSHSWRILLAAPTGQGIFGTAPGLI